MVQTLSGKKKLKAFCVAFSSGFCRNEFLQKSLERDSGTFCVETMAAFSVESSLGLPGSFALAGLPVVGRCPGR